ncbi:hypothetical protein [Achromobacter phage Motura]|uniref:Uncharacterized protein n=1 Tax=Achromobacter phage Motura TaxID=2591403 RepID=A0A514CT11_9CAUD|nr:hypothetical protein H1O15_gp167 [Achromobacter phage Motura]QDH83621.1 hypothetical protein [Achromobacter phage Motura]
MAPHQQRVVSEHSELMERLTKLKAFFETQLFKDLPLADQELLETQAFFMDRYADTLAERITRFGV